METPPQGGVFVSAARFVQRITIRQLNPGENRTSVGVMTRNLPILLMTLALSCTAQAEVYKTIGPDGTVIFSDQPAPDAEKVRLPPVPTYTAPKLPPPAESAPAGEQGDAGQAAAYKTFALASPAGPEATVRDTAGNISVRVKIDPALQAEAGHRIQFLLDGVAQGEPVAAVGLTFQNVDRGSHTVSAQLLDAGGNVLRTTNTVTVFLHRPSVNLPARQ